MDVGVATGGFRIGADVAVSVGNTRVGVTAGVAVNTTGVSVGRGVGVAVGVCDGAGVAVAAGVKADCGVDEGGMLVAQAVGVRNWRCATGVGVSTESAAQEARNAAASTRTSRQSDR